MIMRRNDYLLCLVIIMIALCGFWYLGSTAAGSDTVVRITRHHELILQQPHSTVYRLNTAA